IGALMLVCVVGGCGSTIARSGGMRTPLRTRTRHPDGAGDSRLIAAPRTLLIGRSDDGRPIHLVHLGDPRGPRVLVLGCIHGTECAGVAIADALERTRPRADLW